MSNDVAIDPPATRCRTTGTAALLDIEDLHVAFDVGDRSLHAVRGLNLHVAEGQTVGLVGESGCGKTVSMLAVVGLLGGNADVRGRVRFRGEPVSTHADLAALRGSRIAMVFQDSMSSLNPLMQVGVQVAEAVRRHTGLRGKQAREKAIGHMQEVRLEAPEKLYHAYPHELSGGMRQRMMIAGALACKPDVLIADEATTGLDVTTQAEILDLLTELRSSAGLGVVFVSHDVGAVADLCDDVYVIYGGRVIEHGPTTEVFASPLHPYTRALLSALPRIDSGGRLAEIEGLPPSPDALPPGCAFAPRCAQAMEGICDRQPPTVAVGANREVECWLEVSDARA